MTVPPNIAVGNCLDLNSTHLHHRRLELFLPLVLVLGVCLHRVARVCCRQESCTIRVSRIQQHGRIISFVTNAEKEDLWTRLSSKFTLPTLTTSELTEALKLKVKKWPLKKMAQQFNNHKKKLYNNYIKKKTPPEFTGALEKQQNH
jgi:hypothetical protein